MYYSYFKTVIDAPTFAVGVHSLYANNLTEFPNTINTLKRFNLYPEVNQFIIPSSSFAQPLNLDHFPPKVFIGALFRTYTQVAASQKWVTKQCWRTNRGEGLSPVMSCEGIGDPANFYVAAVWIFAAFTTVFIFLAGVELRYGKLSPNCGFRRVQCFVLHLAVLSNCLFSKCVIRGTNLCLYLSHSDSIIGGMVSVLCFFYNHGEVRIKKASELSSTD